MQKWYISPTCQWAAKPSLPDDARSVAWARGLYPCPWSIFRPHHEFHNSKNYFRLAHKQYLEFYRMLGKHNNSTTRSEIVTICYKYSGERLNLIANTCYKHSCVYEEPFIKQSMGLPSLAPLLIIFCFGYFNAHIYLKSLGSSLPSATISIIQTIVNIHYYV